MEAVATSWRQTESQQDDCLGFMIKSESLNVKHEAAAAVCSDEGPMVHLTAHVTPGSVLVLLSFPSNNSAFINKLFCLFVLQTFVRAARSCSGQKSLRSHQSGDRSLTSDLQHLDHLDQ